MNLKIKKKGIDFSLGICYNIIAEKLHRCMVISICAACSKEGAFWFRWMITPGGILENIVIQCNRVTAKRHIQKEGGKSLQVSLRDLAPKVYIGMAAIAA